MLFWSMWSQHCPRKLPVQCWVMANRKLFLEKQPIIQCRVYQAGTTSHRNIAYSALSKYIWVKMTQENYLCNICSTQIYLCRKTDCFKCVWWPVFYRYTIKPGTPTEQRNTPEYWRNNEIPRNTNGTPAEHTGTTEPYTTKKNCF